MRVRAPDDRHDAGQDGNLVRIAPEAPHALFHARIGLLRFFEILHDGEDDIGRARREILPTI